MNWKARRLLAVLAAAGLVAISGCATDDAVEKDAKKAEPDVKKAADDAKDAGTDAVDEIDDNDSK